MVRDETRERAETGQSSRALVGSAPVSDNGRRVTAGRPMADFLTQLIVSADPDLRPSRLGRTRVAAALYAQAAGRRA